MIYLDILGKSVAFAVEMPPGRLAPAGLQALAEDMAAHINAFAGTMTQAQADTFQLTDRLVIFVKNRYKGRTLKRSYMAMAERTFFWTLDEFTQWEPGLRRPTAYFHDAFHVRQFLEQGPPPNDPEVLIDREQEAMQEQLDLARLFGCDQPMVDWLANYAGNRERIRARLNEGLGITEAIRPHFLIL